MRQHRRIQCVFARRSPTLYEGWTERDASIRGSGATFEKMADDLTQRVWEVFGLEVEIDVVEQVGGDALIVLEANEEIGPPQIRRARAYENGTCPACKRPLGFRTQVPLRVVCGPAAPCDALFTRGFGNLFFAFYSARLFSELKRLLRDEEWQALSPHLRPVQVEGCRPSWKEFLPFTEVTSPQLATTSHPAFGADRICEPCGGRMAVPGSAGRSVWHVRARDAAPPGTRAIIVGDDYSASLAVSPDVWRMLRAQKRARGVSGSPLGSVA